MNLRSLVISLIICFALFTLAWWLWQRQPKNYAQESSKTQIQNSQNNTEKIPENRIEPEDRFVSSESKITLKGTFPKDNYLIILTGTNDYLAKIPGTDRFEQQIDLTEGINLVQVISLNKDLGVESEQNLSYFHSKDKDHNSAASGNVKNIFSSVITVNYNNSDIKIITKSATDIILPSPSLKQTVENPDKNVRVGDYIIALGKTNKNQELEADSITILRSSKPQLAKLIIGAQTLSDTEQNIFSVKNLKDNKIVELKLDKNSEVWQNTSLKDSRLITKDKKAIIIYKREQNANLTLKIFIL